MIRHLAWEALRTSSGAPTRAVDRLADEAELEPRDRGLLRHLVTTEARRRGTLRALVAHFARGKPSPELAAHLRLGLAQLFFLDQVPDHAAVSETVSATTDTLGVSKAPYVNGVLRTAARARREGHSGDPRCDLVGRELHLAEPVFRDPEQHPLLWAEDALSMPAQVLKGWVKRLGRERAFELAAGFLEEPRLSIRATRPGERAALADELAALGLETSPAAHPAVLVAARGGLEALLGSEAFREGRATVQGESALRAAELCAAAEGERWLDLCAAPGGKTAVLAQTGAHVLACDVGEGKLARLRETCARLGVAERIETRLLQEGRAPEERDFDGVLVDVPCSNTGVLGRRPEARWRYGPKSRASLAELQRALLASAAERVAPGGRLVYSTCSLEPDENGLRVRAFLAERASWELEDERESLPAPLAPAGPVDGGYAARLRRAR